MTRDNATSELERSGGYTVRRPRVTDSIGLSLRAAFDHDHGLPMEMARMIDALDLVRVKH